MLVLFFTDSLCHVLRGDVSGCKHRGSLHTYLLGSGHLWKANSAFDFAKSWNERNRLLVEDVDMRSMLEFAEPEDVDLFGKMMLVATLGVDEVRGWFDFKGSSFD